MQRQAALAAAASILMVAACYGSPSATPTVPPPPTAAPTATSLPASAAPTGSSAPLPTVFIPASDSLEAGLVYRCGVPFPIEIMEGPSDAEKSTDPATVILHFEGVTPPNVEEWWLLSRTPNQADYLGRLQSGSELLHFYARSAGEGDTWQPKGLGTCTPGAVIAEGAPALAWWIRAEDWPSPTARKLQVQARDGCLATLRDRLVEPVIRADADRIIVILAARPETERRIPCSGDQVIALTVTLEEPVGDRSLWDGANWPLRDAHIPTEPLNFNECCG